MFTQKSFVVLTALSLGSLAVCADEIDTKIVSAEPVVLTNNLLRNGSFELGSEFNGSPMRMGTEHIRVVLSSQKKCQRLPFEGWWQNSITPSVVTIEKNVTHSGTASLCINPASTGSVSVFSAPEIPVKAGFVTLSAWVRTTGAHGKIELEFVPGNLKPSDVPRSIARKEVALPETTAQWTRVQLTTEAPANAAAVAWFTVDSGQVLVDDVQFEKGKAASDFNVRSEELLHLSFQNIPAEQLPFWKEKEETPQALLIRNDSRNNLKGSLEVWAGPWTKPKTDSLNVTDDFELAPGSVKTVSLPVKNYKPDAYIIVPVLKKDGAVIFDGGRMVDPSQKIGGFVSNSMIKSQSVIRFGITTNIEPAKIFGVGNGMLPYGWNDLSGNWHSGWPLALFAQARGEDFTSGRGQRHVEDQSYLFAAAGVPLHRMENPNAASGAPEDATFQAPGAKGNIDFWNPEGMAFLKSKAEETGKVNGRNPQIVTYQMANETIFPFKDGLCPTPAADAHFRAWCKDKYTTIETLNQRWGTSYKSWNEVEQPVSASYADEVGKRPVAQGAAAIDWTATLGNITPEFEARIKSIPGRGMDWLRWRTWSSLWMYDAFRDSAKKYDQKTLYSTNLAWPNFWPQMCMPFYRKMDMTMLDVQYTSGLPRSLGTPMEMIEMLEMAESNAPDKPIWGMEIYVQPQFPAEFTALQNWGVLAHGMTNNLLFAWGPYADTGIPKEVKAWENPKAGPMWTLIDLDGTKLPAYFTNKRSISEIHKFHRDFDGLSLKRIPTDTAFFVSRDTAEYISYETASKPWGSLWTRTRNNLSYLLRMNGITADFVDDETMPNKPGRFKTIIVPASYAMSQESAGKIADFARSGGTVVLAGVSGVVDPWAKKYDTLGGPAWAELQWNAPDFKSDTASVDFAGDIQASKNVPDAIVVDGQKQPIGVIDETKVFKGTGVNAMPNAEALGDATGKVVGWKRPWGKGKIVAYSVVPDSYGSNPHPSKNHTAWMKQLIETSDLHYTGRWNAGKMKATTGTHGEGAPVVEVVVRARSGEQSREKFVFVLNQGGGGQGAVEVPISEGSWQATDALSGKPLKDSVFANGMFSQKITVKPWEYRVFHLVAK